MPAVSVVIPVHNRAAEVVRAIDSVRAQTFGDWELMVVDDASTDGTADAVAAHVAGDPRMRLIRLARNGGVSAARNAGIREARGEWIAFLDSDDWWMPAKLERQMARAAERVAAGGAAPAMVMCWCERLRPGGAVKRNEQTYEGVVHDEIVAGEFVVPSTWMVRAEAMRSHGLFDEELRAGEDSDFLYSFCETREVTVVREVLVMKDECAGAHLSEIPRSWESYEKYLRRHEGRLARVRGKERVAGYWIRFAEFHRAQGRRACAVMAIARAVMVAPSARTVWRAMRQVGGSSVSR